MTIEESIRIGSGSNALAQAQAARVAKLIHEASGTPAQFVQLPQSSADRDGSEIVAALRTALEDNVIDIAVHAFKDVPATQLHGTIAFTPERESAQEALCSKHGETLDFLSSGDRVGADSPVRLAQLRELRPDLTVIEVTGDLVSQLAHVGLASPSTDASVTDPLDAVIVGVAALNRIGESHKVSERLPFSVMLPAPGQGAIAIEVRANFEDQNPGMFSALRSIHHQPTFLAISAERSLLRELNLHSATVVGAYAHMSMGSLKFQAIALDPTHGKNSHLPVTARSTTSIVTEQDAVEVGKTLAQELLSGLGS